MISLFKDIPEAIENTIIIAKRCSFFVKTRNPILPKYPGLENISETDYLSKISLKGLKEIYETIDLGRIQRGLMKDTNEAFNVACDVMSIILLNIDPIKVQDDSQDSDSDSQNGDSQEGNGSGEGNTISDEELQDMLDSDSLEAPSENLSNDDGSDSVELSR